MKVSRKRRLGKNQKRLLKAAGRQDTFLPRGSDAQVAVRMAEIGLLEQTDIGIFKISEAGIEFLRQYYPDSLQVKHKQEKRPREFYLVLITSEDGKEESFEADGKTPAHSATEVLNNLDPLVRAKVKSATVFRFSKVAKFNCTPTVSVELSENEVRNDRS